jgi:hypothetical protein
VLSRGCKTLTLSGTVTDIRTPAYDFGPHSQLLTNCDAPTISITVANRCQARARGGVSARDRCETARSMNAPALPLCRGIEKVAAMLWGALLGVFVGLVGYEILRRDRSWDDGRWARVLLGSMIVMLLVWA